MKVFLKYMIVYFCLIIIFTTSLVCTAALPRLELDRNVLLSSSMYRALGKYNREIYIFSDFACTDNHTDTMMVNIAYHLTRVDALKSALSANYYTENNKDLSDSLLVQACNHKIEPNGKYTRYWHGYLLFLRPLLMFFSISEIRMLNSYLIMFLLIICVFLIYKKANWKAAFAFVFSLMMMNLFVMIISLQFVTDLYIVLIACIVFLNLKEKHEKHLPLLFFVLGAVTMFFDFYTYPILTFGYTIAFLIIRRYEKDETYSIKSSIKFILMCLLTWLLGYLLIWVGKNILAYFIVGPEQLNILLNSVKFRLSGGHDGLSRPELFISALKSCIGHYYYLPLTVLGIIVSVLYIFFRQKFKNLKKNIPLLVILIIPFLWMFVAANPTYIHSWFQGRMLGISFFCLIVVFLNMIDFEKVLSYARKKFKKASLK